MTLTNRDLKALKDLMEVTFEEKLDDAIETRIATKDAISHLPTKVEFYEKTDELIKELKDMREEFKVLTNKIYDDHEPRISKVENKLQIQSSV